MARKNINWATGSSPFYLIITYLQTSCSYLAKPMLLLKKIQVTQFKNYGYQSFTFDKNSVGICGLNGKGKTNLLDAIYYCCFTKSYFSGSDSLNIRFGEDGFRLEAVFLKDGKEQKLVCINRGGNKKEILLNDVPYEKFSKHIGTFPAVMIAPDDIELITGTSDHRRRYIDTVLSQSDPDYLQQLILYNKVLQQRNSLLKNWENDRAHSPELLCTTNGARQTYICKANCFH